MANNNINLLPTEEKSAESFNSAQKRVLYIAIALIVITGVTTFVILGLFSTEISKRTDYIASVQKSAQEINSNKSKEELVVVVKDKSVDAQKVLDSRINYDKIFGGLAKSFVPQGVYFSSIKFNGAKIAVSGKAKTSADAAGIFSALVSREGSTIFSNVNMESLSSDEKGNYSFTLSMNIVSLNNNQ